MLKANTSESFRTVVVNNKLNSVRKTVSELTALDANIKNYFYHVRRSDDYEPSTPYDPSKSSIVAESREDCNKIRSSDSMIADSSCGLTIDENLRVVVRLRAPNAAEDLHYSDIVVKVVDDQNLVFDPKRRVNYYGNRCNRNRHLKFDRIFDVGESNKVIYDEMVKEMVSTLFKGFNFSMFFYGATGSGKTYTMLGTPENQGIVYYVARDIFDTIERLGKSFDFVVCLSYLQIYNEQVYDLLCYAEPLTIMDNGCGKIVIPGLLAPKVGSLEEFVGYIDRGTSKRTQFATGANKYSSRSHAVIQIHVKMTETSSKQTYKVKLSLTDLAGNERLTNSTNTGERFFETAKINRSLFALHQCITSLAFNAKYIPYRYSKLTRLLKDTLSGESRTIMIVNIAPTNLNYEDTCHSLFYATRAKKIKIKAKINKFIPYELMEKRLAVKSKEVIHKQAPRSRESSEILHAGVHRQSQSSRELRHYNKNNSVNNEEFVTYWNHNMEKEKASYWASLKDYLSCENRKNELILRSTETHEMATILQPFSSVVRSRERVQDAQELNDEAKRLLMEAQELQPQIIEKWNVLVDKESKFNDLLTKAACCPLLASVAKIIALQRQMFVMHHRFEHVENVKKIQKEKNDFIEELLQNINEKNETT